jgi:hypothetical protein
MATVMRDKLKKALGEQPRPVNNLNLLKPGDLVMVCYQDNLPGRLPGTFSAEVVTVDKEGKNAALKRLSMDRTATSASLRQLIDRIVDSHERDVMVSFPSAVDEKLLKELQQAVGRYSIELAQPELGEILAFIYPADEHGRWDAGVWTGSVAETTGKDLNGDKRYRVVFYLLSAAIENWIDEITFRRDAKGFWWDETYGVRLTGVRRATPGEKRKYEADRNEVAKHRAIPNAPKPKS